MNSERDAADTGPKLEPEAVADSARDATGNEVFDDAPELEIEESHDNTAGAAGQRQSERDQESRLDTRARDGAWPEAHTTDAQDDSIIANDGAPTDDFGDYQKAQWQPPEAETPDDTPSLQESLGPSSPRDLNASPSQNLARSPLASPAPSVVERARLNSPRQSSLLPFDRRFTAKRSISGTSLLSSNRSSIRPGQLDAHSRASSISTQAFLQDGETSAEAPDAPWEVVRWSRLGKVKAEVFSEAGKRKFGKVTCIAVTSSIVLGTSRGLLLIFDAKQQLKAILGEATKAVESGAVTAVAISADHSTVAAGHATGAIFTWEIGRPAKPFLQIPPASLAEVRGTTRDGHVVGVAVLHLGFLGVRHTALVSADDRGMAFSHLATRGMGALGRTVKTTRILGRYPDADAPHSKPRKPSSVLAFSPLPMGTAEYGTDAMGLVAVLTPYLLVIVSTTPVAQTQHKIFRAKDVAPHSAMSGCLAWYPAMQSESKGVQMQEKRTVPKLAYCWSNVLTIIEVTEIQADDQDRDSPPELLFSEQHSLRNEEPIVAMQWLSRNILAALTVSQQLVILEHPPLRATGSSDLLRKHIYHVDLFSNHLGHMVEKFDDDNANMHGVVADAFYMSFRSYKGRLFLLGFDDISIGTLSNWADRLLATMEHGDYVGAIRLASSYYAGQADLAAVGLPLSTSEREEIVGDKLIELMSASLRYAFGRNPDAVDRRASTQQLEELLGCCFDSCQSLNNQDFLFEEVFTSYVQEGHENMFLDKLQERILVAQIQFVPPVVLKVLVNNFADRDLHDSLEELLCRLIPTTMDLDQVTKLCKSHELFDALFYVWSQGINDYTTILGDLLDAIDRGQITDNADASAKIFTFLSYTLTGRVYPTGISLPDDQGTKAKAEMYAFLFFGSRPSADGSRTKLHSLRQLLHLDVAAFMSMLNEAFEDPFLNGPEDRPSDDELGHVSDEQKYGLSLNRQYVLTILNGFMAIPDFDKDEILFLDMFIARSLPKYPQFIMLPGHIMQKALTELCEYATVQTADDCQLSAEYLLSIYRPPDVLSLVPMFLEARFYRVIKTIYRSEGQYDKLLQTCIVDDETPESVFECIADCFRSGSPLTAQQKTDFQSILRNNLAVVVTRDLRKAAITLDSYCPDLHQPALQGLGDDSHAKYIYLHEILEPGADSMTLRTTSSRNASLFNEQYIRLLCDYDPQHVRAYIEELKHGDLELDAVLPALEASGMVDSAVVLMAREGQVRRGVDRLIQHLHQLGAALQSLLGRSGDAPDSANIAESADDLISSVEKYAKVGTWLCQRHNKVNNTNGTLDALVDTQVSRGKQPKRHANTRYSIHHELTPVEALWLDLVDAIVQVTRDAGDSLSTLNSTRDKFTVDIASSTERFRSIVQTTFTALLRATTSSPPAPRFLPILRGFLNRASKSSPSLAHLRQVLSAIFSAYAFEEGILGLANKLLEKDLFVGVEDVSERRKRGWRPLGLACGGCSKKVYGPGTGREIWNEWHKNHHDHHEGSAHRSDPHQRSSRSQSGGDAQGKGKGKGKAQQQEAEAPAEPVSDEKADAVVVFACRHLFHRKCLQNLLGLQGDDDRVRWTCPLDQDGEQAGVQETDI